MKTLYILKNSVICLALNQGNNISTDEESKLMAANADINWAVQKYREVSTSYALPLAYVISVRLVRLI